MPYLYILKNKMFARKQEIVKQIKINNIKN
uniref:Uncharacterized protein n=1 Tax=viral metagenome TaxID=1070528 RepID=A0A6C0F3Q9_9ZZZZ